MAVIIVLELMSLIAVCHLRCFKRVFPTNRPGPTRLGFDLIWLSVAGLVRLICCTIITRSVDTVWQQTGSVWTCLANLSEVLMSGSGRWSVYDRDSWPSRGNMPTDQSEYSERVWTHEQRKGFELYIYMYIGLWTLTFDFSARAINFLLYLIMLKVFPWRSSCHVMIYFRRPLPSLNHSWQC